ncbi:MAG: PAS domain S-box protein, partial [Planctomycetes bacterium]|nr:PAS domain S-box protein [Planctomycetota bacterium]
MGYSNYSKDQLVKEVRVLQSQVAALEQANEELQQKEKYYGHLMETMSDGVVIEDSMNRIVYVNASFCETLGFGPEALVGRPTTEIIHPDGIELYLEQTGRRPYEYKASYEQKMRGANGSTIPVIISVQALRDEKGDYDGCMTVITDITEHKKTEDSLRRSEEEFRILFENAQAAVYRTTLDGSRYLMANQTLADMFDMSKEEMLNCSPVDTWADPADREELIRRLKEKGVVKDYEIRAVTEGGEIITTLATVKLYKEKGFLEGVSVDITERKRMEEALRVSGERYRSLVEGAGFPIFMLDREGKFLFLNWIAAAGLGGYPKNFVGKSMKDLFPGPVGDYQIRLARQVFDTGEGMEVEMTSVIQGEIRWYHTSINPVKDVEGQVESVMGIAVDITEQKKAQEVLQRDRDEMEQIVGERTKDLLEVNLRLQREMVEKEQAEEALRESEKRFRDLIDNLSDAAYEADSSGNLTYANKMAATIAEKPLGEMLNKPFLPLFNKPSQKIALEVFQKTLQGESPDYELTFTNGKIGHFKNRPLMDDSKNIIGVFGMARDITERKHAEKLKQIQHDLVINLAGNTGLSDSLESIMRTVLRLEGFDAGGIYLIDDDSGGMDLITHQGLPQRFVEQVSHYESGDSRFQLIRGGKSVYMSASDFPAEMTQDMESANIHSLAVIPICFRDKVIGCLNLASHSSDVVTEDNRRMVESIAATQLGVMIAQARSEEALRESEATARALLNAPSDVILLLDTNGDIVDANETLAEKLNIKQEQLIGANIKKLFSADVVEQRRIFFQQVIETSQPVRFEDERDGRWNDNVLYPILDSKGAIQKVAVLSRDITEHKRQEDELKQHRDHLGELVAERTAKLQQSEEKYRQVVNNSHDIIYALSPEGILTFINPQALKMGYTEDEIVGHHISEFIHPDDIESVMKDFTYTLETGETPVTEFRMRKKDGSFIYAEETGEVIYEAGQIQKIVGSIRDITERKQAEEEIRKFKTISDVANYGTAISDLQGNLLYLNNTFARMHGYEIDELIHRNLAVLHNEEQLKRVKTLNVELIQKGNYNAQEVWHQRKDGSVFPTLMNASIILDKHGNPSYLTATAMDISQRIRVEEVLRESEQRFRAAAKCANDLIYEDNDATGQIEWHGDIDSILGEQSGESISTFEAWKNRLHSEDRDRVINEMKRHTRTGDVYSVDYRIRHQDGGYRYWVDRGTVFQMEGKPRKTVGACADITEQKKAEEGLRNSEQRFRMVFEHVTDGILLVDVETKKIFSGNPMMCQLLGYSPNELTGLYILDIHPLKDSSHIISLFNQSIREEGLQATGISVKRKDGGVFYTDINATLITLEGKRYMMGVFRDITERLEAQAQLQQYRDKMVHTERLASLGMIGANLMHRLNQPFTVIRLMLEDCQAELAKMRIPGRVKTNLTDGLSAITNAEAIVRSYQKGTPRRVQQEEVIDLLKIAHQITQILADSARRS